jgi:predicted PhzF superfamily epimerase YddE/YHI9
VPTAHVLRVFTDDSGAYGNHLGIVIEGESALTQGRRQAIATELGYSETVFFQDVETAALRIFTPAVELPLAGHPLVGASWFLTQRLGQETTTLRPALAAEVATWVEDGATWIRARVADAPPFEYVELESEAAVRAVQPAPEWGHHYVWAWTDRAADRVYARLLAPDLGVPEDPATGSAALVLASRLGRAVEIVQAAGCLLKARPAVQDGWSEVGGFVVSDGIREVSSQVVTVSPG